MANINFYTTIPFYGHFLVNLSSTSILDLCFGTEHLKISSTLHEADFLPVLQKTAAKALKEIQSTETNQWAVAWPFFIFQQKGCCHTTITHILATKTPQ